MAIEWSQDEDGIWRPNTRDVSKIESDASLGASNELSEILVNGNTTSGNNIILTGGDALQVGDNSTALIRDAGGTGLRFETNEVSKLVAVASLQGSVRIDGNIDTQIIGNGNSITLGSLGNTVADTTDSKGLVYAADYSANFTDRSLVDKAYVDSAASVRTNHVLVKSVSDFPAAVGGVITLADNTAYEINGTIALGTDRIVCGVSNIIYGVDKTDDILIYTGTGNMISSTNQSLSISKVTLVATGAGSNILNLVGSGTEKLEIAETVIANSVSIGTISGGFSTIVFRNNLVTGNAGGLDISGTNGDLFITDNPFENFTGTPTFLALSNGASSYHTVIISRNMFEVDTGQTGLNISQAINVTAGGTIQGNSFEGAGTKLAGINAGSPGWRIPANSNIGIAGKRTFYPYDIIWNTGTYATDVDSMLDIPEDYIFPEYDVAQDEGTAFICELLVDCSHQANGGAVAIQLVNETDNLAMGFGGNAKLDVNTIAWQSGSVIRYTFNGAPNLSRARVGDYMTVESATNAINNGVFLITAVNDVSDYIEVLNPNRTDNTDDEAADSPATAYGGSVLYTTITTANVYEEKQTVRFGGIDNTKTYRVQGRAVGAVGGNPPDALFQNGRLKLINI